MLYLLTGHRTGTVPGKAAGGGGGVVSEVRQAVPVTQRAQWANQVGGLAAPRMLGPDRCYMVWGGPKERDLRGRGW